MTTMTTDDQEPLKNMKKLVCTMCGEANAKLCTGCNLVAYCGKFHQREHWPVHKRCCTRQYPVITGTPEQWLLQQTVDICGAILTFLKLFAQEQKDKMNSQYKAIKNTHAKIILDPLEKLLGLISHWMVHILNGGTLALGHRIMSVITWSSKKMRNPPEIEWDPQDIKQFDHITSQMPEMDNMLRMVQERVNEIKKEEERKKEERKKRKFKLSDLKFWTSEE